MDSLEDLWNTTPTTDEIQREMGFLRKDLKILKTKKALLEEARNITITIIKKVCTSRDNFLKLVNSKELGFLPVLCHVAVSKVMGIREKALELLVLLNRDSDMRETLLGDEDVFSLFVSSMVKVKFLI